MIQKMSLFRRCAALVLTLALLGSSVALAETALINGKSARVYGSAALSGKSASVKRFTPVEVLSVENGTAKISCNGYTVYIDEDDLFLLNGGSREMVFNRDSRVYAYPDKSGKSAKIKAGTAVNVLYTANGCALVEKNGIYAYAYESHLDEAVRFTACNTEVVVTAASAKVFSTPYSYGKTMTSLPEGTHVTMTGSSDQWARLEAKGVIGYCRMSDVEPYQMTAEAIFANEKLSVEQKVYYYIVNEMKLSPAAACGILANIDRECSFNTKDCNSSSGAYGLCQWLGGRKNNLLKYCEENGWDSAGVEGQCRFLKYELENKYTSVWKYMKNVENTAQGAYDAGYYWCYYYEIPENRAKNSEKRGTLAMETYWPRYQK